MGKARFFRGDPRLPTYGYNGTTYRWSHQARPDLSSIAPPQIQQLPPILISGLPIAAIPLPTAAPLIWDMPDWNPIKAPCTSRDLKPAHAKGVNVVYADTHAKFAPFLNHLTPSDPDGNCLELWSNDNGWRGFYPE